MVVVVSSVSFVVEDTVASNELELDVELTLELVLELGEDDAVYDVFTYTGAPSRWVSSAFMDDGGIACGCSPIISDCG